MKQAPRQPPYQPMFAKCWNSSKDELPWNLWSVALTNNLRLMCTHRLLHCVDDIHARSRAHCSTRVALQQGVVPMIVTETLQLLATPTYAR